MRNQGGWVVIVLAVSLSFGCGKQDLSPRIMCDWDGKVVPTPFTFDAFSRTLATEHGAVEASGYTQLVTRSVVVDFKSLDDGTLLAERVLAISSGMLMPPAVFFGLTNGAPAAVQSRIQAPLETLPAVKWGVAEPTTAPATNN